jgi:endonuclease YncB( thermonuclease family)
MRPKRTLVYFDNDHYGRSICTVWAMQDTDEQIDVGEAQIEQGMAWWYRVFAHVQPAAQLRVYEADELAARASRAGLWRDPQPVPPWEWRRSEESAWH